MQTSDPCPSSSYFPLSVGHAVGIVFDSHGEFCPLLENIAQGNVGPAFDVGEVVNIPCLKINKARHAHPNGSKSQGGVYVDPR